ncbi:efflux RND transporter permease subunit [Sinisalibacter aestuarii]|uniref:Membrane transport protein MMPL domain-containing protein n=1 Tax=Sinisalibacter aestuarii TaxID=2949426 RepID=A0ABQ5LZ03_9RHOB|nr:MMPL family transporter [Sinisalibacter aestuarii]GKY89332.1 hypothetical protein STA1M1_32010 [Sinisalibacter aestuarii]
MRQARNLAAVFAVLRSRLLLLWLLTGLIAVVAVTGMFRLRFDDELVRFFNSDIPAYQDYVALGRAFEGDGNDVIAFVEASDFADPVVAAAMSDFLLDAQFIPGVRAALSPFILRFDGAPLFPYPPLPQDEMAARLEAAQAQVPMLGRLLSADRQAMVVIMPITERAEGGQTDRHSVLTELARLGARAEAASGARLQLSGYPVLRDEVASALIRDIVLLNTLGVVVGFAVAVFALRSFRLGLLTLPGPALSVALGIGLHGHLGVTINTITITLPVLILVLATSDAIHISFERGRQAGRESALATLRAIRRVAVACVFAAVTTAVAFGALATSRSEIIAEMGAMGVLLTLSSVVTVLLTQMVVLTTAGRADWFNTLFKRLHDRPPAAFGLGRLTALALRRPRLVSWVALVVLAFSTWAYSQAGPRYSLLDTLRGDSPVRQVFSQVEDKLAPVSLMHVVVNGTDSALVRQVAEVVARETGSTNVQSLASIEGGAAALADTVPEALAQRLVSADGTQALVSVPFRYENGETTLALADRLEAALAAEPGLEPGMIAAVTGLPVMSARVAGVILDEINRSLLIALGGVALLILAWLRNLRVALISLIPNMLPVTLIGGWLMLSGSGIEFSNGMALTVAFGIAVDDTLHVLNRLRLAGGVRRITREGLEEAFGEVTPALVTTSLVLFFGMSGSFLAKNLGVAEFGGIAMSVFVLALLADLLVLPAALAAFGPRSYLRTRRTPE